MVLLSHLKSPSYHHYVMILFYNNSTKTVSEIGANYIKALLLRTMQVLRATGVVPTHS